MSGVPLGPLVVARRQGRVVERVVPQTKPSKSWKAPPKLKEPYTSWKEELKIWENFTDIEAKKQGGALFLSLPDPSSARDAVLELGASVINGEKGIEKIIEKLDSIYLKDGNITTYQAWQAFNKFSRPQSMSITEYAVEFNRLYSQCKKNNLTLPTGVQAIQFLESANLPPEQHRLILATCPKMEFEPMRDQILKISTDISVPKSPKLLSPSEIKIESTALHTVVYSESRQFVGGSCAHYSTALSTTHHKTRQQRNLQPPHGQPTLVHH